MSPRICKDCRSGGREGKPLDAPYPGPRCYRHHKAHQRAQREARAGYQRKARYGVSQTRYDAILAVQGGVCVCGRKPGKRRLAVDHDHSCCPGPTSCGECVRGLLCWTCNKFLQHIGDNPDTAQRLANYLQDPPAAQTIALSETYV